MCAQNTPQTTEQSQSAESSVGPLADSRPRNTIARNATLGIITDVASIPLLMLSTIILARALGPTQRGMWAVFIIANAMAAQILSVGAAQAIGVYSVKRLFSLRELHGGLILLSLFAGGIGVGALLLVPAPVMKVLPGLSPSLALISMALVALTLYTSGWEALATGLERIDYLNAFKAIQVGVTVGCPALMLLVFHAGVEGLARAWIVAILAVCAGRVAIAWKLTGGPPSYRSASVLALVKLGSRIYAAFVPAAVWTQLDVLSLGVLAGSATTGVYSVANGLATRLGILSGAVSTAANARITGGHVTNSSTLTARLLRATLAVGGVVIILIGLTSHLLMRVLYGQRYVGAAVPLIILSAAAVAQAGTQLLAIHLVNHRERPSIAAAMNALTLGVSAALLYVLIPRSGATGAATAMLAGSVLQLILYAAAFVNQPLMSFSSLVTIEPEEWQIAGQLLRAGTARLRFRTVSNKNS